MYPGPVGRRGDGAEGNPLRQEAGEGESPRSEPSAGQVAGGEGRTPAAEPGCLPDLELRCHQSKELLLITTTFCGGFRSLSSLWLAAELALGSVVLSQPVGDEVAAAQRWHPVGNVHLGGLGGLWGVGLSAGRSGLPVPRYCH